MCTSNRRIIGKLFGKLFGKFSNRNRSESSFRGNSPLSPHFQEKIQKKSWHILHEERVAGGEALCQKIILNAKFHHFECKTSSFNCKIHHVLLPGRRPRRCSRGGPDRLVAAESSVLNTKLISFRPESSVLNTKLISFRPESSVLNTQLISFRPEFII